MGALLFLVPRDDLHDSVKINLEANYCARASLAGVFVVEEAEKLFQTPWRVELAHTRTSSPLEGAFIHSVLSAKISA